MLCSFCQKAEPVRIDLKTVDLRICPACKASYLPAEHLPELRRCLENTTKLHWIKALENNSQLEPLCCIEHGVALEKGELPGFSLEAFVPKCCTLQHLDSKLMVQVLKMFLDSPVTQARPKKGGISRLLAAPFIHLWEKRNPVTEDEIDRLQYNFKFKEVLDA